MKQVSYFIWVTLLFTGLTFSNGTTAQLNQPIKKELVTNEGKIIIVLPALSSGAKISGTVAMEATGRSSKQIKKNETALSEYRIMLLDQLIPARPGIFTIQLPTGVRNYFPFEIKNSSGEPVKFEQIPIAPTPAYLNEIAVPPFFVAGDPAAIKGNFDGDAANTNVNVNGKKAELLAESPGQLYFKLPEKTSGPVNVDCTEQGTTVNAQSNILNLEVAAGKLNLLRGETTSLQIAVSGLQGLNTDVPLVIQNLSPQVIQLAGGDDQTITITPQKDAPSGTYSTTRNILSAANGSFSINVSIHPLPLQEDRNSLLCNCYIGQQTFLVPPEICARLNGTCNDFSARDLPQPGQPDLDFPPSVSFFPPEINEKTGEVSCRIVAPHNDVVAVLFSEKAAAGEKWNPIGNAVNNGTTWQCSWNTLNNRNGFHSIRARVVGKNDVVAEKFMQVNLMISPGALNLYPGENISLNVSDRQVKDAEREAQKIADSIRRQQEKLDALQKKYEEYLKQQSEDQRKANELQTIDKTLDKIPGLYRDSLRKLVDSLNKLKANLPAKVDAAALQKAVDDAEQRLKDCQDRLEKLKKEKEKLEKELEAQKKQIEDLLNQMDALHHNNNWIGGHGYHKNGDFWYGYVGDERSNTNISAEASALKKKLKAAEKPYNQTNSRLENCNNEIAVAEAECDKLKKALDNAKQAAKNGDQYLGAANQVDELCRQIDNLLSALRNWCAANPGACHFKDKLDELSAASPRTPQELSDYLDKMDDVIKEKQKKEADLNNSATENANAASTTDEEIKNGNEKMRQLENAYGPKQAEADNLRKAREKQLADEREALRKKREEEEARRNTPKPQPNLTKPVNPLDGQLQAGAYHALKGVLYDYVGLPDCSCPRKALLFAQRTNPVWSNLIGRIGVSVAFAPLEAFPGLSLGVRLGIGTLKAIGSSLYGGAEISEELAKNLFNVIGGEIFPKLVGSDFAGARLNELANGGLEAIMREEGIRAVSWEGELEIKGCGKVKGTTTMLFNPNTGWVTMLIRVDDCLVVVKYQVNKDGIAVTNPIVRKISG